jgi:hypothetical protein
LANHSKPQTDLLPGAVHEEMFVKSFIEKARRERALVLMKTPAKRHELTGKLAHLNWLDERYATQVPASVAHTSDELVALLKRNGAGQYAWVISEDKTLDGRQLPLDEAMKTIWGVCQFTALSCIPGKLAFVRGESMKSEYLLQHP